MNIKHENVKKVINNKVKVLEVEKEEIDELVRKLAKDNGFSGEISIDYNFEMIDLNPWMSGPSGPGRPSYDLSKVLVREVDND